MSDSENYWIPRTLEDPPLIFIWETDVVIVFAGVIMIFGVILKFPVVGVILSVYAAKSFARLKENGGSSLFSSFMYWYTPAQLSKRYPSYIREYIGH
jgi:conjugal transfer pilus assembly protein TraL